MTGRSSDRAVTPETLMPIVWKQTKVITTELLAKLYGTQISNIQKNYERNLDRFEDGKHFFKLEGAALRELKQLTDPKSVSANTRSLTLWTERGAARHAKMLETDKAWEVFERLEDSYFRPREAVLPSDGEEISTVADRRPLYHGAIELMVMCRMSPARAYAYINAATGSPSFAKMKKSSVPLGVDFVQHVLAGTLTLAQLRRLEARSVVLPSQSRQLPLFDIRLTSESGTKQNKQ